MLFLPTNSHNFQFEETKKTVRTGKENPKEDSFRSGHTDEYTLKT